jgi:hypothetical protein
LPLLGVRLQLGEVLLEPWPADRSASGALTDLGGRGEVAVGDRPLAECRGGRRSTLVALGLPTGIRRSSRPGDQHLKCGQRPISVAHAELRVAEAAQAATTLAGCRVVVGGSERSLGQLGGAGGVVGAQRDVGAGEEESGVA